MHWIRKASDMLTRRHFIASGLALTATPVLALTEDSARSLIDRLLAEINRVIDTAKSETAMFRDFETIARQRKASRRSTKRNSTEDPDGLVAKSRAFRTFELLKTISAPAGMRSTISAIRLCSIDPLERPTVISRHEPRSAGGSCAIRWSGRLKEKSLVFTFRRFDRKELVGELGGDAASGGSFEKSALDEIWLVEIFEGFRGFAD